MRGLDTAIITSNCLVVTYNILTGLVEKSNKIFNRLCSHRLISECELKYFTNNFKIATNLEKLHSLPKIHKRLVNVPGRPVVSNCGTPTEKVSEYLEFLLNPFSTNVPLTDKPGSWLLLAKCLKKDLWKSDILPVKTSYLVST